ncbi:BTAD domain-containing putative transcriptional regulator [Streptomyces sp. NPDC059851]|uniref:AfsR/SARP family transcriptional regulator n=1 Tax=Streptomyces sp. NPDC059851 TaxID=3346971 RepID=UPI0036531441
MLVRFGLLGELTLHLDGEVRPIPGPKAGVLLATLLLDCSVPVSVDRLMAAVWGDHPPRTALASLHNHFARLRSALGPERDRLLGARGAYALRVHPGELDAEVFGTCLKRAHDARRACDWQTLGEESAAALALWRGRPVPEFPSLHGTPEIAHLIEQHLQAVELWFDAQLQTGRHRAVTADIARYAASHPLREPFHRQLITALHQAERTADAIAAYHSLRRTLADELGIDPAPTTQQVFSELLDPAAPRAGSTGPDPLGSQPTSPLQPDTTTPGRTGADPDPDPLRDPLRRTPFQIPRDIADFTGRTAELAALRACLLTGAADAPPPVAVISGMGGIGKTTLALHAAHGMRTAFPDGQLYADLRGFGSGTPRTAHDLLARFLTDLGVPASSLPEDTDDRAALYRATLAERRVLIVLDNARDAVQVAPLLLGSGPGAAVVTSRHALTGLAAATRITLQPLAADEQRRLLAAICGPDRLAAEQIATEQILTACAGLPLALRIVGARLAHGGRTVPAAADRLYRTGHRLTALALDHLDVREVFLMSYQALSGSPRPAEREAAVAFRRLGLWAAHPFSAEAASALLDHPVERTFDLLDILVGAHLLQNPTPGTFRFHDLLGEFAAERAEHEESREEREAGLLRMVTWYRAATRQADVATRARASVDAATDPGAPLPEFTNGDQALAWITAEMPAIHHAVRTASVSIRPELSWGLVDTLFGWTVANWWATQEWEQPANDALAAAERVGDLRGQAKMENFLGVAHGSAYRNEVSLTHLAAAAALYEQIGDTEQQARSLSNYGAACAQAGRVREGLTAVRRSIALRSESGPPPADLHVLGSLLLGSGDAAGAEPVFRQCLEGFRREGQSFYESIALVNLGDSLRALDRRDEAFSCLEESLVLSRQLDNDSRMADTLEALARTHLHFGDRDQARANWREALTIAEKRRIERVINDCVRGLDSLESDMPGIGFTIGTRW